MTIKHTGQLEVDHERGVVYFHSDDELTGKLGIVTLLRICQLPKPIPRDTALDITYGYGTNWGKGNNE